MQPATPAQSDALKDYIEQSNGIDLNEELDRGEAAQKVLRPYIEHIIRMGAGGVRQSVMVDNVEYEVSITITPVNGGTVN